MEENPNHGQIDSEYGNPQKPLKHIIIDPKIERKFVCKKCSTRICFEHANFCCKDFGSFDCDFI